MLAAACASGGSPLQGYRVLIESRDSLSDSLAKALSRRGFSVKRHVSGGSPPTAALVTFTFREVGDTPGVWFHARLADTRSGAIVAVVSVPLDSLGRTAGAQAKSVADSFAAHLRHGPDSPP
jgi:hypothetical protein